MRTAPLFVLLATTCFAAEHSYRLPFDPDNRTGGEQKTACVNVGGEHGHNPKPIDSVLDCTGSPKRCKSPGAPTATRMDLWRGSAECVDWHGADLKGKDFRGYYADGADLEKADLSGARLQGVSLAFVEGYAANFDNVDLSETTEKELALPPASTDEGAEFLESKRQARLEASDMTRTTFRNAKLKGAHLSLSNFSCANFQGADLSGATLINAIFSGAYFGKANLNGAKIGNSTFKGANFSGADLTGITTAIPESEGNDPSGRFKGAIFDAETKMPWSSEKALRAGMVNAAGLKPSEGLPGAALPTKENCDIEVRQ